MKTVKFYPTADGLIVRDPQTLAPLDAKGEEKPLSGYWLRRERDGDVSRTAPSLKSDSAKAHKKSVAPALAKTSDSDDAEKTQ